MLPYNPNLMDTNDIASMLGLDRRYVTNIITKQPDFPAPLIDLTQKTRRWDRDSVVKFFKDRRKIITPPRKNPAKNS